MRQTLGLLLLLFVLGAVSFVWLRRTQALEQVRQAEQPQRAATMATAEHRSDVAPAEVEREAIQKAAAPAKPRNGDKKQPVTTVALRGIVRDPAGTPIEGAIVWGKGGSTETGADGCFAIEVLAWASAGEVYLRARARDRLAQGKRIALPVDPATVQEFVLGAGARIRGRVLDAEGTPVVGARVGAPKSDVAVVLTDDEGRFRIGDFDPTRKTHRLSCEANGFLPAQHLVEGSRQRMDDVEIVLQRGARLHGFVFDPARRPVAGARVRIGSKTSRLEAKTDTDGAFAFSAIASGPQMLLVEHEDFALSSRQIDGPEPGGELQVVVDLSPGFTVRGRVVDAQRQGIEGARLRSWSGKQRIEDAFSAKDGSFAITHVPEAGMFLQCTAKGYVDSYWRRVDSTREELVLTLDRAASIAGTVIDARSGAPVRAFEIWLSTTPGGKSKGNERSLTFTDQDGQFDTLEIPLSEGQATDLEIRAKGYAPHRASAVARWGARPGDLVVRMEAGTTLRGRVIGPDQAPVARAAIRVIPVGAVIQQGSKVPRERVVRSDTDGRFELAHVQAGRRRIAIEHDAFLLSLHEVDIPRDVAEIELTLRLDQQASLDVLVLDAQGAPFQDVPIALDAVRVAGMGKYQRRLRTDKYGRASIRQLPDGVYRLSQEEPITRHIRNGRHVRIVGKKRHEVTLQAKGATKIVLTLQTSRLTVPPPKGMRLRLVPLGDEDLPWEQRRITRNSIREGAALVFADVEQGRYRVFAETWMKELGVILRVDREIDITLPGRLDLALDVVQTQIR